MKKGMLFLLLFCSLWVRAQKDTSGIQFTEPLDSTASGSPDGKLVSKEIGPAGGTIVSEDGKVDLIFPAGALTANTVISVQPVTNLAPNGSGKAYQFEPSGIQFKKPVQIIFHYTDEEAEICPPDLMGLALQDHTGKWSCINYEDWDSTGKKLMGFIQHFSSASNVYMLRLRPEKKQVRVGESAKIDLLEFNESFNISVEAFFRQGQKNHWYVNGVEMGNRSFGYLSIYEETERASGTMRTHATYLAPQFLIRNENPVKISAEVKILSGRRRGQYRSISCRILVYDTYRVSVIHTSEHRAGMGNEVTDSANFIVWIYPNEIKITNINNYSPSLTKAKNRGPCKLKLYFDGADGLVHLTEGYQNLQISRDEPPEVLFRFLALYERLIDRFSWVCPGVSTIKEDMYAIPIVPEINFIANGQVQRINVDDNGTKYKLIVVPFRN